MTSNKMIKKPRKKPTSIKEVVLTKEDFFRMLDKAIQPTDGQPPLHQKILPVKEKRETSE